MEIFFEKVKFCYVIFYMLRVKNFLQKIVCLKLLLCKYISFQTDLRSYLTMGSFNKMQKYIFTTLKFYFFWVFFYYFSRTVKLFYTYTRLQKVLSVIFKNTKFYKVLNVPYKRIFICFSVQFF